MDKLLRLLKRIFFLQPLPTFVLAFSGYGAAIFVEVFGIRSVLPRYASYAFAAYAVVITVTGFRYIISTAENVRKHILNRPLMQKLRFTAVGKRYAEDIHSRTAVGLFRGFFINILYIILKLSSGIYYRSTWFILLSFYYALLAVMRFLLVRNFRACDKEAELRSCRLCGFVLLVMDQALTALVIFIVHQNASFYYAGFVIYAMALYVFYSIITAIIDAVKVSRYNSPSMSVAKTVNLVGAMVSVLSLTTAMFTRFGEKDDPMFHKIIIGAVGGVVCVTVIFMAVFTIVRANRGLRNAAAAANDDIA